jgi:hypothetical protein
MSAVIQCVYVTWRHPHLRIEVMFSGQLTRFSTTKTALRAVKEPEEGNETLLTSPDNVVSPQLQ